MVSNSWLVGSSRLRPPSVLAAVLILAAMVSGVAGAQTPSYIEGIAWLDVDADGLRGAGEPVKAGVNVSLFDSATNVLLAGPTPTAVDGSYLFETLSAGDYDVVVDAPSNYWVSSRTVESQFTTTGVAGAADVQGSSDPILLDGVNSLSGLDVAIRPRPELAVAPFGPGVIDGLPPYNTTGSCQNPVANPTPTGDPEWSDTGLPGQVPGDDCGSGNGVVRTQDNVSTIWSITSDNYAPGAPDLETVIFEQIIHNNIGSNATFSRIPASCLPPPSGSGGTTPPSAIITDDPAPGDVRLVCNLGSFSEGFQESLTTSVLINGASSNGSTWTTSQGVYSLDSNGNDNAVPDLTPDLGPITNSAAPSVDVSKDTIGILNYGTITRDMSFDNGLPSCDTNPAPCDHGPEKGLYGYFIVSLATDQESGTEPLAQPVVLDDQFFATSDTLPGQPNGTPYPFEYEILNCLPNTSKWGASVYGTWVSDPASVWFNKSVVDSGTCTLNRDDNADPTSSYDLAINGADLSGSDYPTQRYNGSDLSAGPYYLTAHRLQFFIPFRSIDLADGVTDGVGAINVSNCIDDFDPVSITGTSNYGAGFEPGYNRSAMPTGFGSNSCAGPRTFELKSLGAFSKYNYGYVGSNGIFANNPGNTSHSGSHTYEPSQTFPAVIWNRNRGTTDLTGSVSCDIFDNTTLQLSSADSVGQGGWTPAYLAPGSHAYVNTRYNTLNDTADFVVEYASADFGPDDPLSGGLNAASGRYEGDWSVARQFHCDDSASVTIGPDTYSLAALGAVVDPDGDGWITDPTLFANGIDDVNMVRARFVTPDIVLEAPDSLVLVLPLRVRDVFNGGPHDGILIPAGTVMPNFGAARWDEYLGGNWTGRNYQPSPETSHSDGDRVTLTRSRLAIQKHTISPVTAVGQTGATLAGNPIVWEVITSLTSSSATPADVDNVTVVDVLPASATYDALCTVGLVGGTVPSLVEENTPGPGETALTWFLGTRTPNTAIDPIRFCTDTDSLAPNGTSVINQVNIAADGVAVDPGLHNDSHTIILEQAGSIQLSKSVDITLDDLNDSQTYSLSWSNFAPAFTILAPTMIDVFSFDNDAGGDHDGSGSLSERSPESDFSGQFYLTGAPDITWLDGSTPVAGDPNPELGQWFYTSDLPWTIDYNPLVNASDWCSEVAGVFTPEGGAASCPASFSDVTGVKFVSNYSLARDGNPRQGMTASYTMQAGDPITPGSALSNQPGDLYTNRFALSSASLTGGQYLRSNSVSVQVASYSIGDLVFADANGDGDYDVSFDTPAPDGTIVELRLSSDDSVVDTYTLDSGAFGAGRYLFSKLGAGDYYVTIPASVFSLGGSMSGWFPTAIPAGALENDDNNDTIDQHAYTIGAIGTDGLRTNDLTLSADPPLPGGVPLGHEPLGDNTGPIADVTADAFSNLTLDIGAVPPSGVSISKKICTEAAGNACDESNNSHWAETVEIGYLESARWRIWVTNSGQQLLTDVVVGDLASPTCARDSATLASLASINPGESVAWTCQTADVVSAFTNEATVTATATVGPDPTDSDTAAVTLPAPSPIIHMEKATNTVDADTGPGPYVAAGDSVVWTYVVTNPGNMGLGDLTVVDDNGTAGNPLDDLTGVYQSGDIDGDGYLDESESWVYELSGTSTSGSYTNNASVTADPVAPGLPPVGDSDPSSYFGFDPPDIDVEKATNAAIPLAPTIVEDADGGPNTFIDEGDLVTWTYLVTTNGSNAPLANVVLIDDSGTGTVVDDFSPAYVSGDDGDSILEPGETWLYQATGPALAQIYTNSVVATADGPAATLPNGTLSPPDQVSDTDLSAYFGFGPSLTVEKSTNTDDADTATGPYVAVGDVVTWAYSVTNTGNIDLGDVTVTDDQVASANIDCGSGNNVIASLAAGGPAVVCTATGTAVAGQYANTATSIGTPVDSRGNPYPGQPDVNDTDPSHYFGFTTGVVIEKSTNGNDADIAPGPSLNVGSNATWIYSVTNTGNTVLSDVTVTDDQIASARIDCGSGTNLIVSLAPSSTVSCSASGVVTAGQYSNIGSVVGTPVDAGGSPISGAVSDTDPSHYSGFGVGIHIEKATNTVDADLAPGPIVIEGDAVIWTYVVTNIGDSDVANVVVTDDQFAGSNISCDGGDNTIALIQPGGANSVICTASGVALAGQYVNTGSVVGDPVDSQGDPIVGAGPVSDDDDSHYFGAVPGLVLEKLTQGQDADSAPGPMLATGGTVRWTYEVTNNGNIDLSSVRVGDDQLDDLSIVCPAGSNLIPTLAVGVTEICEVTGTASAGQYQNTGDVTGSTPALTGPGGTVSAGSETSDTDPSHYFGVVGALEVEKATNGTDADLPANGLYVLNDTAIFWTYEVSNVGNVALSPVNVVDDSGTPGDLADDWFPTPIEGATAGFNVGDVNDDNILDLDESWLYSAQGIAVDGSYRNLAFATGITPSTLDELGQVVAGLVVSGSDPSGYLAGVGQIEVVKSVDGADANTAPGLYLDSSNQVSWTYEVSNTGGVPLEPVAVTDDQGIQVTCPESALGVGESMMCSGGPVDAVSGQYTNIATATGVPNDGFGTPLTDPATGLPADPVIDHDPANYFGIEAGLEVAKSVCDRAVSSDCDQTNDEAWVQTASAMPGEDVVWRIEVNNTGSVDLAGVSLDDQLSPLCAQNIGDLSVGESKIIYCEFENYQAADSLINRVVASSLPDCPAAASSLSICNQPVSDSDTATINPPALIEVDKAVDNSTPTVGTLIHYTLTVSNTGSTASRGLRTVDDIPVALDYIKLTEGVAADVTYDSSSSRMTWVVPVLNPGESASITYQVRVTSPVRTINVASTSAQSRTVLDASGIAEQEINPRAVRSLPLTGASTSIFIYISMVLMLIGGSLILVGRRKTSNDH